MSAPMVRALIEGRKTQTRRVIVPQPDDIRIQGGDWLASDGRILRCPFGMIGDVLWVREALRWKGRLVYDADGKPVENIPDDAALITRDYLNGRFMPTWARRLSLEIASVRAQRVQVLCDSDAIAEGMAKEFLPPDPDNFHPPGSYGYCYEPSDTLTIWPRAAQAFAVLWDSINGKKPGHAWADNPWVWAISFTITQGGHHV